MRKVTGRGVCQSCIQKNHEGRDNQARHMANRHAPTWQTMATACAGSKATAGLGDGESSVSLR